MVLNVYARRKYQELYLKLKVSRFGSSSTSERWAEDAKIYREISDFVEHANRPDVCEIVVRW